MLLNLAEWLEFPIHNRTVSHEKPRQFAPETKRFPNTCKNLQRPSKRFSDTFENLKRPSKRFPDTFENLK